MSGGSYNDSRISDHQHNTQCHRACNTRLQSREYYVADREVVENVLVHPIPDYRAVFLNRFHIAAHRNTYEYFTAHKINVT